MSTFSQYLVELPGVPKEERIDVEADVRKLVDAVSSTACNSGGQFYLKRVLITSEFEKDVNSLTGEPSNEVGYVASRNHVRAIGKTIPLLESASGRSFVIVVDSNLVSPCSIQNPHFLTTLLHEAVHVAFNSARSGLLDHDEPTTTAVTRESLFNNRAQYMIDEFDVDRCVDQLVGFLSKRDGTPWSLRELEEAKGLDWIAGLTIAFNDMSQFIDHHVREYRTHRSTIDDLLDTVYAYLKDVLILLSHTGAIYGQGESWESILVQVRDTLGARRFFGDRLQQIIRALEALDTASVDPLSTIAAAVEHILRDCGLSLQTIPEGIYVSVNEPALSAS